MIVALIVTRGVAFVVAPLSEKSKIAGVPVSAAMSAANDVSAVRFGRWWWCWRRRRRSTTCGPAMPTGYAKTIVLLGVLAVICALQGTVDAAGRTKSDEPRAKGGHKDAEPVIEEVNAKQLERLLNEKDFVAVYWYARSCTTCDKVLAELEKIDDDTDHFGVDFVKINDKRLAKQYGIKTFPALSYFREKEPIIYEGDLMDEENVLDFLTSLEAMDLPDRIEEVNSKILEKIVEDTEFVAVLFYKPDCKKCLKALQELENIDDEADQLGIGFVKIADEQLADEYNLGPLPVLVYYRHQIPIIYEHELSREEDVLEWLIANKSTGDEEDVIEDVTAKTLQTLIGNIDNLVVLFYDHGDEDSMQVLTELEKIDDDCDKHGIQFVKIDDEKAAKEFGIDSVPAIVYFEKQIPNVYDGDVENEDEILEWLLSQLEKDEIEDVTDEMLDRLIKDGKTLAVLFYDNNDRKSQKILNELENIDDECDQLGVIFVKIDNAEEAKEYGIEKMPGMLYFEKGIPTLYEGNLEDEEKVLKWLEQQKKSDQIEDITDEMLDMVIEKMPHVAVLFYDKDQKKSQKILAELENIDDDCDQHNIAFVKIHDLEEAKEYGIDNFPTLVLFERRIPHMYEGDLMNEDQLLGWLLHQKKHTEIPEVTDEMMEKLIETAPYLAVLFYDKDDKQDIRILNELENIDDELEKEGIVIVRMDNDAEAKEYGIDHLPTLVYFENKIPAIYEGDLLNEDEVLEWLVEQKNTATIEEVTDEILTDLIEEHEYVVAYFSGDCDDGDDCDKVLQELENIDDELDETGIIFVTTEDTGFAKKHGIKTFPTLAFFRNKDPLIYKGDIEDEDEVLSWITDENTLEIPGKIEEVNGKMLENILEENDYIVVFFYKEGDKKSQKILQELENIDDECEEKDIDFVKISDEGIEKEYDLPGLPALAFYRHKFRQVYTGDMMHEEAILEWILELRTQTPDVIESVDRKTLQVLINDVEHLAVFFYDDKCEACPEILEELETIDDDTDKHGIQFVKSNDAKLAAEIGVFSFPALVYYETGVPIMYDGNLLDESEVLDWMVKQKTDESIEEIDRDTLTKYIETKEFLAVIFYKEEDPESPRVLRHVELIDDEAAEYGIKIVRMKDRLMAKKYGFRNPPGITYFRKGKNINYDGDIDDEEEILDWLTNPENMELTDHIERINKKMFHKIRQTTDYLAVFFYSSDCKQCGRVLAEIEHIDDEADGAGIKFVKIDDKQLSKQYGVFALPAILFFKMSSKDPVIYAGDLYDEEQILQWLMTQKDPSGEVIEDLEGEELLNLIRESDSLAVYFWNRTLCDLCQAKYQRKQTRHKERRNVDHETTEGVDDIEDCEQCMGILEELENIDDDCDRHGITFIKTQDYKVAEDYGVTDFPVLVYFENQVPNVFEGELAVEEEVLQWLITQKTEDRIELITRVMLETSVEETQYLAVYFYKQNCHICDEILEGLEKVDDECDVFGIHLVKIQDPQLAKRYSIKTFPALVYFRNGNPLLFEGDLQNEESVLEWLIDDDNRELADEIESVNDRMLERLLDESPFLAVFFYDEDCPECDEIMEALEKIDGEADLFGIDFVKVASAEAAEKFGILNIPSLVYFRKKTPLIYDGDLTQEDKILQWLTSQDVFEIKNEIEEVNKKMLDKLLDENEFLAVFFYEHDSKESEVVNEKLEDIDGETDNLDITFVKMGDPRYARKWGVTKLPAIVYFRKRFPSIYRGDMHKEQEVLEWLRKNRYRQPELNIYMYMLIAITVVFAMYTGFLLSCFRSEPTTPAPHPKQA
ncbi:hulk isoform X2 [Andrena cerasifolii]|uniref:hulk isoform X2 n=1 Tax=Andrena cerasifolii TaxID=2819439 RepID=UPI004037CD42